MGVWQELTRRFGASRAGRRTDRAETATHRNGSLVPDDGPVTIDLHTDDPEPEDSGAEPPAVAGPTPRSRQEMIAELKRSYDEVLGLVRKVDQHLDRQEHRSERLLAVAERTAAALEVLPDLRDQNERIVSAIDTLARTSAEGHERADERMRVQQETLAGIRELTEASADAQQKVTESIGEFSGSVGGSIDTMAEATSRLGEAIASMRQSDLDREQRLAGLVARSQRWMVVGIGASGAALAAAIIIAILVLGRG